MEGDVLSPTAMFIIGQTIALVILVVGIYVGLTRQLTRMETNQTYMNVIVAEHRGDHKALEQRVQGISRTVERHDALLMSQVNSGQQH